MIHSMVYQKFKCYFVSEVRPSQNELPVWSAQINVYYQYLDCLPCAICSHSGPCDLRPLHLTIPSILRPLISNITPIFSVSLEIKTTSNLRIFLAEGVVLKCRDHCT